MGAYEYGAPKRLYEDPGFEPTHVAGVSIGAITAAALVGASTPPQTAEVSSVAKESHEA